MIKAALTGLVFLSIFALLFDRAYRYAMADERTDLFEDKRIRRIFVLFSALGLALCIHLLIQNRFVYYWDYGGYWTSSYLTMKSLFKAPMDTVRSGIFQICALFRQSSYRFICGIAAAAILGIGAANCYFPSVRRFIRPFAGIYAQQYNPLQRGDLDELHHVANDLNKLTEGTDDWVYICASGDILNSSIMGALNEPYSEGAVHNLYWTANVDLRDGFPAGFLKAKYVVVTDPVQLHLAEGTQEAVRFPNQEVQNAGSPIGRHFRKLPGSFVLDNDVKAYIYQKTSDFERSDLQYLADYYSKLYPGKDDLFADVILHSQDD